MLSILFGGCALHQACVDKKHDVPQVGWVTISGTVVPATTVAVDEYGKSLADCVFESRVCDILTLQQRLRTQTPSSAAVEQLTQADTITLSSLVTRIQKLDAPALAYAEISTEVQSIQATAPGFRLPGTWLDGFPHYAFDSLTATEQDQAQLRFQLESLADPGMHASAVRAYQTLRASEATDAAKTDSLRYLSSLARDRKFRVSDDQMAKAWTYKLIIDIEKSKRARVNGDTNVADVASVTSSAIASLYSNASGAVATDVSLAVNADDEDRYFENSIMVLVERSNKSITMLPLDQMFHSPLGSLWLFPGDHINLMKLSEIHFLNGQQNKKRVGVTGLVAQQGILNTDASRLNHLLAEIDSNIDIRSNLIILNYPMGNVSAKLMLPYTSMAVAQSSIEVEKLYSYIGLVDGTVVTMDHTDANSILRRSRTLMQQAAQARLAPASHLCTRESDRGASSLGAIKPKTDSKTLRIPLVSDACGLVQQTGKNSWAIAENWWQDFGFIQ